MPWFFSSLTKREKMLKTNCEGSNIQEVVNSIHCDLTTYEINLLQGLVTAERLSVDNIGVMIAASNKVITHPRAYRRRVIGPAIIKFYEDCTSRGKFDQMNALINKNKAYLSDHTASTYSVNYNRDEMTCSKTFYKIFEAFHQCHNRLNSDRRQSYHR